MRKYATYTRIRMQSNRHILWSSAKFSILFLQLFLLDDTTQCVMRLFSFPVWVDSLWEYRTTTCQELHEDRALNVFHSAICQFRCRKYTLLSSRLLKTEGGQMEISSCIARIKKLYNNCMEVNGNFWILQYFPREVASGFFLCRHLLEGGVHICKLTNGDLTWENWNDPKCNTLLYTIHVSSNEFPICPLPGQDCTL